jgi:hypothetical protein
LIANGLEDVIGFIVFLAVAGFIWAIQALAKMAQKGRMQRPQRRPQQRPPEGVNLEDEIGEFLRKAARRRQQEQAPPPPARQPAGEQAVRAEVVAGQGPARAEMLRQRAREAARRQAGAGQAARRAAQYGPPQAEARPSPGPTRARITAPATPSVAAREEPTAETPRIASLAALAAGSPGAAASGASAAGLYALLSEPANLRQAIVLTEILNRPEERW